MENGLYEAQWPKDGLAVSCFVHEILNFRYHWHPEDFELNILLCGQQYHCRGRESALMEAGDVVLIDPNVGHASYGQAQNTIALVVHFPTRALRGLAPRGKLLSFAACRSDASTRNEPRYRHLRGLAAQLILALTDGGPYAQLTARASLEMMLALLCNSFRPEVISSVPEVDDQTQRVMRAVMAHIETHYQERLTLEEIAALTQYNRTYISTLFHRSVGIGFHDYLTRVRLQNALRELVMTDKGLTAIALENGFADLKTFNSRFRELLQCLPSEYRKNVLQTPPPEDYMFRRFIPCDDPAIRAMLERMA